MRSFFKSLFVPLVPILLIVMSWITVSCYSFTGSSLSPEIKTIRISPVINRAGETNPLLSQQLVLEMESRFLNRTRLVPVNEGGDMVIDGTITRYDVSYTNVNSDNKATQNQLAITVKINYQNNLDNEKSFDRSFTSQAEYDANRAFSEVENELVDEILKTIVGEIFNSIVDDW